MNGKALFPADWQRIYHNPLAAASDVEGFRMEGQGVVTFPEGKLRLENGMDPEAGQAANFVFWCPEDFPADVAVSWEFRPLREPGLAILFMAARGAAGKDLFDPSLTPRIGIYDQYHHGEMDAFHISYFRRKWPEERQFHTCNLRKSYGFHLVTQGADPIPGVADVVEPYRMLAVKQGGAISFYINELPVFSWQDDGEAYGPLLGGGRIGFRQMAPLLAEYANLQVFAKR
jgi:hypothetical protein